MAKSFESAQFRGAVLLPTTAPSGSDLAAGAVWFDTAASPNQLMVRHSDGVSRGVARPTTHTMRAGQDTWTNQPIAVTEYLGSVNHRMKVDLTGYSQIRLQSNVATAGAASAVLSIQYSTDDGATWANFDGTVSTATGLPLNVTTVTGNRTSAWQAIAAAAQADVLVRIVGKAAASTGSPVFTLVSFQVK